jgi:hypothetical protein
MAKKDRRVARAERPWPEGAQPVGLREPCPCGSGERYKNCHGRTSHAQVGVPVRRPFAGVPFERDLVAFREFVPSAVAKLPLVDGFTDRSVTLATLLPMAWPAIARPDGEIWLGVQLQYPNQIDPARDLVSTLRAAIALEPGNPVEEPPDWRDDDPTLAALMAPGSSLEVEVREGFGWWTDGADDETGEVAESLERANAAVSPTAKLAAAEAAYWCEIGSRTYVRWVRDEPEDALLDALARMSATDAADLGPSSRLIGSFRTCGLVVPVWELEAGTQPDEVEEDLARMSTALSDAVASTAPLSDRERSIRANMNSRQVTLR